MIHYKITECELGFMSRKVTTKSDITEDISSEESVTKEHVHKEEQNDETYSYVKIKRDKPSEEEDHTSDEHGTLEAFTLNESLYEIIDDSHLDNIFVPQADPVSSPITKKSSCRKEEQSQKTFSSTRISTCIENQTAYCPHLENDGESSSSESSTNCNDNQLIYLQPVSSLIANESSCHTEEQSHKVFPTANNSTCIANNTSCDTYLAIEEEDSDALDDSSTEISEEATNDRSSYLHPYNTLNDRSSYLHPYNTLFNKTSSCHIYEICLNEPFSE
ncbi:unnamed protein product [Mytilus edulis]|uniref:Uncharacterized protein n=1 Tax=Mytilus edulis TaxID=6550 RepID=A0A8S3PPM6_MYTED|nr:unnamed protein product [Mytilus edulis]